MFVSLLKRRNPSDPRGYDSNNIGVPKDFDMFDLFDSCCCVFDRVFGCLLLMNCVFAWFVCVCVCVFACLCVCCVHLFVFDCFVCCVCVCVCEFVCVCL